MIPAVTASTSEKSATPKTTNLPKSARLATAMPKLVASPAKSASPGLLSLNLKAVLHKEGGDTGLAVNTPPSPSSPSSRSKIRVERSITEVKSHKRALNDADGPGVTTERVQKRQRTATPPGSARENTSPRRQMFKTSRAVAGLSTFATDALQRLDTASPPASPRTGSSTEDSARARVQGAPDHELTLPALPQNGLRPSILPQSTSAPQWRSSSNPGLGDSTQPSAFFVPASDSHVQVGNAATALPPLLTTVTTTTSQPSPAADPAEFTFTDCDFETGGQLVGGAGLPTSASRSGLGALSTLIIEAELSIAVQAQKEAAAAYIGVLRDGGAAGGTAKAGRSSPASPVKTAQRKLQDEVYILEMAFKYGTADEVSAHLKSLVSSIAEYRTVLTAQGAAHAGSGSSRIMKLTREALVDSLAAMETACASGLAELADQKAHGASRQANNRQPEGGTFMSDLDELDALMSLEILPANSRHISGQAPFAPPRQ